MEGSLANKDEAEKCRDLAKKFLRQGDLDKAVRFFEKSLRLYPLPGVESMRDIAKSEQRNGGAGGPDGGGSAPREEPTANSDSSKSRSRSTGKAGTGGGTSGASPGVRRRPAAAPATPAQAAGGAGDGGGGGAGGSGRAFTPEQERMVKQVLSSKAKGHYGVLGVEKGANDDQIKKAYRKLALRLHPDKNGAPQAHEAFQAIGTAFAVLSDEDKRAHYDRYGDDDGPQGIGGGGGGGGPFGRAAHQYRGAEVSPEDIFNMFFGQPAGPRRRRGGGGVQFNTRVYRAGGGANGGGVDGAGQQGASLMNLVSILGAGFLMLFTLFGSGPEEAPFSLERRPPFMRQMATSRQRGVVEGVPYFVPENFKRTYMRSPEKLRRVEVLVTEDYKAKLNAECMLMRRKREAKITEKKHWRRKRVQEAEDKLIRDSEAYDQHLRDIESFDQLIRETEEMPLPPCQELLDKFSAAKFNGYSRYN
ncbi:unnamed protein product [Pylaiella littoralis]